MKNYNFLKNKYTKWYYNIITKAKIRNNINEYTEKHHIIPKSLGGDNAKINLVRLTCKEHFVVHHLLTKMTIGIDKSRMNMALHCMKMDGPRLKRSYFINARLYELIRKGYIQAQRDMNGHWNELINIILDKSNFKKPKRNSKLYQSLIYYLNDPVVEKLIDINKPHWKIHTDVGRPKYEKNLLNKEFGHLTVINFAEYKKNKYYWNCLCHCCMNECKIEQNNLLNGVSKSCGCNRASHLVIMHKKNAKKKEEALIEFAHLLKSKKVIPSKIQGFTIKELNNFRKSNYTSKELKMYVQSIYPKWKSLKISNIKERIFDIVKNPKIKNRPLKGSNEYHAFYRFLKDDEFKKLVIKFKPSWLTRHLRKKLNII